jgi:hypothetical protein
MYFAGRAAPRDRARARELYRRACDGGAPVACDNLAAGDGKEEPPPPPDDDRGLPRHWVDASAPAALTRLLDRVNPRVLGVGEVHLVQGGPAVRSALARFTDDMLSGLDGAASDLVVETWVASGRCGEAEEQVTADVRATTERPPATESEIERLVRRGRELGLAPHAMTISCQEFAALRAQGGEVDYDRLLQLIGRELYRSVHGALAARPDARVVVYGGALHNDRAPNEGVAAYSYGVRLAGELGAGYVELDLYLPELVEGDPLLQREPWFPLLARHAGPDRVVLVERGPASYLLLLPRSAAPSSSNTTSTQ